MDEVTAQITARRLATVLVDTWRRDFGVICAAQVAQGIESVLLEYRQMVLQDPRAAPPDAAADSHSV